RVGSNPTLQQMQESLAKVSDYHVTAMCEIARLCRADPKQLLMLMRKAAELRPDLYIDLAGYLLEKNMPDEAAFAYQAAFERATDRVSMANNSDWIVNYYFD